MKQKIKSSKIYLLLLILSLAVLFVYNVTYSYFSAQKTIESTNNMTTLKINWVCSTSNAVMISDLPYIPVTPSTGTIKRGVEFLFNYNTGTNAVLGFRKDNASIPAYIRFWVTCYDTNEAGSEKTNYGKYFTLTTLEESDIKTATRTNKETGEQNVIYYLNRALNNNSAIYPIQGMMLNEDAPIELLSKRLEIQIHFKAVQTTNNAYLSVFNDWMGYPGCETTTLVDDAWRMR